MKKLENEIRQYLIERGWEDLKPSDIAKSISIESAELLELFQWSEMTATELLADLEKLKKVKQELADVFIYALDMSVILNLNTEQIILEKLQAVKDKYPAELIRDGTHDTYQSIKQNHPTH